MYSRAEKNLTIVMSDITAIFVDNKKDKTWILLPDEAIGVRRKRIIKENHVAATEDLKQGCETYLVQWATFTYLDFTLAKIFCKILLLAPRGYE